MIDDYFYQTDNIPPIDVEQMRDVYPKEISSICVHSKERNTLEYQRKVRKNISDELYRYQENSIEFQELLIKDSKKSVWIGINNDKGFTHHIPNYYEFTKFNHVGFNSLTIGRII